MESNQVQELKAGLGHSLNAERAAYNEYRALSDRAQELAKQLARKPGLAGEIAELRARAEAASAAHKEARSVTADWQRRLTARQEWEARTAAKEPDEPLI